MLDRYDSTELIGLIEGELDQRGAAALQQRLARDPQAAAKVQAMLRDRAALRAVEEPALPQDFLASIEPMLTRPMLIESVAEMAAVKPGEFRRKHRRQTHRIRWNRLAAAAVLLLAALGGSWAVIQNWGGQGGRGGDDLMAANSSNQAPRNSSGHGHSRETSAPDNTASIAALGPGTVHHDRPVMSGHANDAALAAADVRGGAHTNDTPAPNAEPRLLAADFAVVVQSKNSSAAESAVSGALADLGARAALVRNFSYSEAQKLAEEYRVAHGGSMRSDETGDSARPMADATATRPTAPGTNGLNEMALSRIEMQQLAERVREQLRVHAAPGDSADSALPTAASASPDAVLAGASSLAPTLEQQLDFSSRGASYTIAVPVSELVALIERLALSDPSAGAATSLRMLPMRGVDDASATPSVLAWLSEGPLVRQAMQRLTHVRSDAVVLLPVVVR